MFAIGVVLVNLWTGGGIPAVGIELRQCFRPVHRA
jgi:hypothetical protein